MKISPLRLAFLASAVVMCACCCLEAADYFPPSDANGGWRKADGPEQIRSRGGMEKIELDRAFEYAQRTSQHGGLLVVRHGWLVYERYYGKGNREANPAMASVGKMYTSIACGIMLKEEHAKIPLGLDQKVFTKEYLPEAFPLNDPRKADVTLGELLSMSSGMHGEGSNPGFVDGEPSVKLQPLPHSDLSLGQDLSALRAPLWTNPGGGYCYSSQSPHVASIVLRHLTGMEMQEYINERLAKPMQWGRWTYALNHGDTTLPHTPGGGDIAVHSTDALRFAYLLLHDGQWNGRQLVPADYVKLCGRPSAYNHHSPFSLMTEVNADGHVAGAPRDAFFKSGAGGFGIAVIPSLDMVIYKMAGDDAQYDPKRTGLPMTYAYDGSRDNWKPAARSQFSDGPVGTDDGLRRTIEMVVAAVIE
jgi:CubicO group peptidase (beta-lactamase class C family)